MYGVLYSVGGKLGIVDTTDGVIELVPKETAISWVRDNGIDIRGIMVARSGGADICPISVTVAYQLMNYGDNGANIFSVWQNVNFLDKSGKYKSQEHFGDFSFKVRKNGKYKDYKGTFIIKEDNLPEGIAGRGVHLKFSNNLMTIIPTEMIKPYIRVI